MQILSQPTKFLFVFAESKQRYCWRRLAAPGFPFLVDHRANDHSPTEKEEGKHLWFPKGVTVFESAFLLLVDSAQKWLG